MKIRLDPFLRTQNKEEIMNGPLFAISAIDGRYAVETFPLRKYMGEAALMRERVQVEVEYLISLSEEEAISLELTGGEIKTLREIYSGFGETDAKIVKEIEKTGYKEYKATNHDVKAIEYFLRERTPEKIHSWIHFGLTSEDVTNIAYRILVRGSMEEILIPAIQAVKKVVDKLAIECRDKPMLSLTHGQPATPTTFGKEMAIYSSRLGKMQKNIEDAVGGLGGKLSGASGNYAAQVVAIPEVDWPDISKKVVEKLGFEHVPLTTQINPGEDLAILFSMMQIANQVMIDLNRDMWMYISNKQITLRKNEAETGSSTMPHKINPIEFENAEGNLGKANSDLKFLSESITVSRLQRDLISSTVKRNIGSAFAHCLLGYYKTKEGLSKIEPNEEKMIESLLENVEILGEAYQTVLRREGHQDAYEILKSETRGKSITMEELHCIVDRLEIEEVVRKELKELVPEKYFGLANKLVDEIS
jgi:adenylosuccinate lyase